VCRDPPPSDNPSHSDTELTVRVAKDSTVEDEQDADCAYCTSRFSEDRNGEDWIRCAKCFRGAPKFCNAMEEDIVLNLDRDKHCFVLSLYLCICIFLFCNYYLCFLC